jgi:hypothetical protein
MIRFCLSLFVVLQVGFGFTFCDLFFDFVGLGYLWRFVVSLARLGLLVVFLAGG